MTCFIIIVDDGSAARLPLAPAAKSKAASPHALPTQRVKIGTFTYLYKGKDKVVIRNSYMKNGIRAGIDNGY